MDYLHFQDGDSEDADGTESVSSEDSFEKRNELEARLYSIVHHNDLSQSLPPDLSEQFVVDCSENGEVTVSVNKDLDETERSFFFNKINLIKSCSQSIDIDSDGMEEEAEDKETEGEMLERLVREYKENVENDSNSVKGYGNINSDKNKRKNTNVLQVCGISNSVIKKLKNNSVSQGYRNRYPDKNKSVFHGYENRKESGCMLTSSDWKTNAQMEYISLKHNFKDAVETQISEVSCDPPIREVTVDTSRTELHKTEMVAGQTPNQDNEPEYIDDVELGDILEMEIRLKKVHQQYDLMVNNPNMSKRKLNSVYRKLRRLTKVLMKMKDTKMRLCKLPTTVSVDNEPCNVDVTLKKSNDSGGSNSVCDSNGQEVTCTNLPSAGTVDECIIVDSDTEVIDLEASESGTKQNVQNLRATNIRRNSGGSGNEDNLICNFVNTSEKQTIDIINLETSGDEQSELNNKTTTMHVKRKKSALLDTPKKWTKKMIKFYHKTCKKRRSFDCLKLIKEMRQTSSWSDWIINKDDFYAIKTKRNHQRCHRCCEFGHHARKCKAPFRPVVCTMCGEQNHQAARCPNAICLFCGRNTSFYMEKCEDCTARLVAGETCKICNGEHWMEVCPDLWRCYHLTTKDGPIVIPNEQKVNPRKCCWACTQEGHFAHECPNNQWINNPGYGSREMQTSCFITDYNAASTGKEVREIVLSDGALVRLNTDCGENFLQNLSNRTKVRIDLITGNGLSIIQVHGNVNEWKMIKNEIFSFVGESFLARHVTGDQQNKRDVHVTNKKRKNNVISNNKKKSHNKRPVTGNQQNKHDIHVTNKKRKNNVICNKKKIKNKKNKRPVTGSQQNEHDVHVINKKGKNKVISKKKKKIINQHVTGSQQNKHDVHVTNENVNNNVISDNKNTFYDTVCRIMQNFNKRKRTDSKMKQKQVL